MVRRRTSARKKRSTAYTGMRAAGAAPSRKSGLWVVLVLGVLVVINLYVFVWDKTTSVRAIAQQAHDAQPALAVPSAPLIAPAPAAAAHADHGTVIEGKVAEHDTIGRLLKHHGLTAAETDEVIRSLSGVLDFRTLKSGEPFRIERGPDGRVQHFELALSRSRKVHSDRQPSGALTAKAE
ncbi:MAG: hypothetical protein ABI467_14440 [Kofleriaceae bacterium]